MKLTVGTGARMGGFALPTILLVSTVMLTILVASIAAAAASRVSLDSQYYNLLAKQAAQSGIARATECLNASGHTPQWSTAASSRDLRPNSDCTGATMGGGGVSAYVVGDGVGPSLNVRTRYSIEAPNGTGIGSILQIVGTTELVRSSSPYTVWRSYQQSLYHRIEAPRVIACPDGFIPVPGSDTYNTSDFCVAKYETKNVGGRAGSQATGAPYADIDQAEAMVAARNACSGCHLITEAEWMTIAQNVATVNSNWTGGVVGNGSLYRGHSDGSPAYTLDASTDDDDGYFGTGNSSGDQRRTLRLNNGGVIWDLSGNLMEWSAGQTSGSGAQPGPSGYGSREWNAVGVAGTGSLAVDPFPSTAFSAASGWSSTGHGIGRVFSSGSDATLRGFMRGGTLGDPAGEAGIFSLYLDAPPSWRAADVGFRMVFVPLSEMDCSAGFVPVPGNSLFGTNNFCVGKYEAKDVGGVATSQAAGTPWVSIPQTSAVTTAAAACVGCRLISEAEWLTIAHNVLNVASNWTGGSVGSGTMYVGHADNTPANSLAASADDDDGYIGTGNSSGNQRRTLRLSNGEVIWDFVGNVWELTTGQVSGVGGQPGGSGYTWRDWKDVTGTGGYVSPNPFPSFGTPAAIAWGASQGIGTLWSDIDDAAPRAFVRGGDWDGYSQSGVFGLWLDFPPDELTGLSHYVGFRITKAE